MPTSDDYIALLRERGKESHVYRKFQLVGIEIAQILQDEEHKSLYIKLAKEYHNAWLLRLAKEVAERGNVRNKGAYFMKLLNEEKQRYARPSYNRR
jgi:hypothetical protein